MNIKHATPDMQRGWVERRLKELLADAASFGIVVTVSQRPAYPLAMGHYITVHDVRLAREKHA